MYNSRICLTVALSALTAVCAHAQEKLDYKVGTRFTYSEYDRWKKETGRTEDFVVRKQGDSYTIRTSSGAKVSEFEVSSQGVYTKPMPGGEGGSFSYAPVKLPLQEGTEWEYSWHYIGSNFGKPGIGKLACTAGALEEVEVPAGKFFARKYQCKGGWSSNSASGGSQKTAWFAPSIGIIVKSVDSWQDSFARGEDTTVLSSIVGP